MMEETIKLIISYLNEPLQDNTILVSLSITGISISALFFTIAIIPLQNISNIVSNDIYKLVSNAKIIRKYFVVNLIFPVIDIFLLLTGIENNLILYISGIILLVLILSISKFFYLARNFLNLTEFVIPILKKDYLDKLDKSLEIGNEFNQNSIVKIRNINDFITEIISTGKRNNETDSNYIKVPGFVQNALLFRIHDFFEIINYTIKSEMLTSFQYSLNQTLELLSEYIVKTNIYSSNIDDFILQVNEKIYVIYNKIRNNEKVYFTVLCSELSNLIIKNNRFSKVVHSGNTLSKILIDHSIFKADDIHNESFDHISSLDSHLCYMIKNRIKFEMNIFNKILTLLDSPYISDYIGSSINLLLHNCAISALLQSDILIEEYSRNQYINLLSKVNVEKSLSPLVFNDLSMIDNMNDYEVNISLRKFAYYLIEKIDDNNSFASIKTLESIILIIEQRSQKNNPHISQLFDQLVRINYLLLGMIDEKTYRKYSKNPYVFLFSDREKLFAYKLICKSISVYINSFNRNIHNEYFQNLGYLTFYGLRAGKLMKLNFLKSFNSYSFYRIIRKGYNGRDRLKEKYLKYLSRYTSGYYLTLIKKQIKREQDKMSRPFSI